MISLWLLVSCTSTQPIATPPPDADADTDADADSDADSDADTDSDSDADADTGPMDCTPYDEATCGDVPGCFDRTGTACDGSTVWLDCVPPMVCADSPHGCRPVGGTECVRLSQLCSYPEWVDGCPPGYEDCGIDTGTVGFCP